MIYIFWTCKDEKEATCIAKMLLEKKLIACANILPNITSIYRWENEICTSQEVKVILKTLPEHFDAVNNVIQHHGSYKTPEISMVSIDKVNDKYSAWLSSECHF